MGCVVEAHLLLSALLAKGVDHGGNFFRGDERVSAECARANALFHADYLAAVQTIGRGSEEGVAGCKTGAAAG